MLPHRRTRLIASLVALVVFCPLLVASAAAGGATPPAAVVPNSDVIVAALSSAAPPADLPGNDDAAIELRTWEDVYGEPLENAEGAWLLTGSLAFPLATVIILESEDGAQAGIEEYRDEEPAFTVRGHDAWTISDRGKWICITAEGPMVIIGQALPESTDEPQDDVEQRSCAVLESTLDWLHQEVLGQPAGTPPATPVASHSPQRHASAFTSTPLMSII